MLPTAACKQYRPVRLLTGRVVCVCRTLAEVAVSKSLRYNAFALTKLTPTASGPAAEAARAFTEVVYRHD